MAEVSPLRSLDSELQEVFLRLFTANEPAIRAFVRRLVPGRDDASDVMQATAVVLWKKFDEFHGTQPRDAQAVRSSDEVSLAFRKWGFRVARFETLAWVRDKARDRLVFSEELLQQFAEDSERCSDELEAQRQALELCLRKIPATERQLVLDAYGRDTRIQEVARKSGRTPNAFYQWLHRIRIRLLECTKRNVALETSR